MGFSWNYRVHTVLVLLISSSYSNTAQPYRYPIANVSSLWTNNLSISSVQFTDGSMVRSILLRGSFGTRFACGFYCKGSCESFFFSVFIVQTNSGSGIVLPAIGFPQVVWSANRNNPVKENATLHLTGDGDLNLWDVDGTLVWSTNTSGKSVVGLNMTEMGNLVLFDRNNNTVWQSFDHPTDTLVPGQSLVAGQSLTASVSSSNSTEGGLISLSVTTEGLFAQTQSNPPQIYYQAVFRGVKESREPSHVKFMNGSIALFILKSEPDEPDSVISVPYASSLQYMKLGSDGHLRVIEWLSAGWKEVADLLGNDVCGYPTVCGRYGICTGGQCSCPEITGTRTGYFRLVNYREPSLGCSEVTSLSCKARQYHRLIELEDVTYFYFRLNMQNIDIGSCKKACLDNCSCKGALFRYYKSNVSDGDCFLPSELFSLMNNVKEMTHYNSSAFIKVQESQVGLGPSTATSRTKTNSTSIVLGSSIGGALFGLFLIIGISVLLWRTRKTTDIDEEDYLDHLPGMPTRFTYEDLKIATDDFVSKLGQGGFGSVFKGTLVNGTVVAVKCLDGIGQVKKSFLAEVETIGSIHHVNLVRLVGFCADKSHRALVYEYMLNGSLEKWIFNQNQDTSLSWKTRRKIILDVAKGLAYLHEDCRQKIFHLDIKPQNILLDESFNSKVSDFGLSKLIDKDQSHVMTTMRGTPGYLAPEWLNSIITEKVDVYSFGVVVLEVVCGRKNLDYSQPDESLCLLNILKVKEEEDHLTDMVDKNSEDMLLHKEEAIQMIRVAAWCLQREFGKRPSMSVVVKVLEGAMDIELNLDYGFVTTESSLTMTSPTEARFGAETPLLPSVLSGPR